MAEFDGLTNLDRFMLGATIVSVMYLLTFKCKNALAQQYGTITTTYFNFILSLSILIEILIQKSI